MARRRRSEADEEEMPELLRRYDPRRWCADPSDLYQAAYVGILDYFAARQMWFMVEKGLPERLAHAAANDGTGFGPQWVVRDGA